MEAARSVRATASAACRARLPAPCRSRTAWRAASSPTTKAPTCTRAGPALRARHGLVQRPPQPAPRADADEAQQPEEGRDEDPGLHCPSAGTGARHRRRQVLGHPRARPARRAGPAARSRHLRARRHAGQLHGHAAGLPRRLGPVDYSMGSGQGVKCTLRAHLYGEFWHRGFTVCADTPNTLHRRLRRQCRGDRRRVPSNATPMRASAASSACMSSRTCR